MKRRNAYLSSMREILEPFVDRKAMAEIMKEKGGIQDGKIRMGDVVLVTPHFASANIVSASNNANTMNAAASNASSPSNPSASPGNPSAGGSLLSGDDPFSSFAFGGEAMGGAADPMGGGGSNGTPSATSGAPTVGGQQMEVAVDSSSSGPAAGALSRNMAITKAFHATVIEEGAASEDGRTLTVIPHFDPSSTINVPKSLVRFLCSASYQPHLYPVTDDEKEEAKKRSHQQKLANLPIVNLSSMMLTDAAAKSRSLSEQDNKELAAVLSPRKSDGKSSSKKKKVLSVFLERTKNGMDFLADGVKMKDYQVKGVDWITRCFCDRGGGILADDMGLGKTLQAIAFLA